VGVGNVQNRGTLKYISSGKVELEKLFIKIISL
jgi:hypothetical protein